MLRGTDLLGSVPASDLEAIAAASRLRTYRRGQVVFTTGDPADTVILVVSGRVKVVVPPATPSSPNRPPGRTAGAA